MSNLTLSSIGDSFSSLHSSPSKTTALCSHFITKFKSSCHQMIALITAGKEPKIWRSFDTEGKLYWNAFDPQSHRFVKDLSEAEMRIWIEQRYRF
jgi:hypothetical protein